MNLITEPTLMQHLKKVRLKYLTQKFTDIRHRRCRAYPSVLKQKDDKSQNLNICTQEEKNKG